MIRFINHASFIVETRGVRLLCDPWVAGSAFHNGWNLLKEVPHQDLDQVDFIWFSHEHPDHFSVPFLRSIPPERRAAITVLYQRTPDRRILSFCEHLGFNTHELVHARPVTLTDGLTVTCGQIPFYDSWLLIETPEHRILNTNDCIVERPSQLSAIRRHVQSCDILCTQFSYANWQDSRENREALRTLAKEKLRRVAVQCEAFNPAFVVPFASFAYFSHVENSSMNADVNRPSAAVRFIEANCKAQPVLLVPNEEWDGLTSHDNRPAMDWWERAYFEAMSREKNVAGRSIPFVELCVKANAAINRVKSKNNFSLVMALQRIGLIGRVDFRLIDTDETVSFDWISGLSFIKESRFRTIDMHSETLAFILDNDFGVDTVNVNARFECSVKDKKRLIGLFSVLELNNTGRSIKFSDGFKFVDAALIEQGLKTIGVMRR